LTANAFDATKRREGALKALAEEDNNAIATIVDFRRLLFECSWLGITF
jgi:hypothetical protein